MLRKMFRIFLIVSILALLSVGTLQAQDGLSGTLQVYLQIYYAPEQFPEVAAQSEAIAQAYMEMHPDVTIELIPALTGTESDYFAWLATRLASGEAPDIAWDQVVLRNGEHNEWWVQLSEYLEAPNSYVADGQPGNARWIELFPEFIINETRAPNGELYQLSMEWVETALYYNADLFAEAGIDASWANWGEYVADMNTVRDVTGADPLGIYQAGRGWSNWYWADDVILSGVWADRYDELTLDTYDALQPGVDVRMLAPEEIAKAVIDGTLSATDPRMDEYLRISQEMVSLAPVDFVGIVSLDDLQRLFLSGELASFWGGSWSNNAVADAARFNWDVTYLPPFTEDDFAGAVGSTYRVGGATGAAQYGITQNAVDRGNVELAVDFLKFLSAPQNFGPLNQAFGGFVPMVNGVEASTSLANFAEVAANPPRIFNDPPGRLTSENGDLWTEAMQAFFIGAADAETTKARLQEIWLEGAQALCAAEGFDWCPS